MVLDPHVGFQIFLLLVFVAVVRPFVDGEGYQALPRLNQPVGWQDSNHDQRMVNGAGGGDWVQRCLLRCDVAICVARVFV
jgi:hypothetical protein